MKVMEQEAARDDLAESLGQMGLSDEQAELMRVATEFAREKSPIERVRSLIEADAGYDADVWREIGQLGWLGIAIPEERGGSGLGLAEAVPIAEQLGRNMLASPFVGTNVAAQAILKAGSDEQQAKWLPEIAEGKSIWTLAVEESDVVALAANDTGGFLVYGKARLVEWADSADRILLLFREKTRTHLAAVPRAALPEAALRRETIIDDTRRAYEMTLESFEIAGSDILLDDAIPAALTQIELAGALLTAAEMVGGSYRIIDYTADYLRTRKQFGKLIGSYQALKHPLVDAFVGYERARSHLYAAANSFADQGRGEVAVRMAKAQGEAAYAYAADRAIQFHGGFGFTYDCDAGLHRRRAIYAATRFGDARVQRRKLAELLF